MAYEKRLVSKTQIGPLIKAGFGGAAMTNGLNDYRQ